MLHGTAASDGIGIGQAVILQEKIPSYPEKSTVGVDAEQERVRYARDVFRKQTVYMAEKVKTAAGEKEAEILMGHILLAEDPFLLSEIGKLLAQGKTAEAAVATVCEQFAQVFAGDSDPLTQQRASDMRDIRLRLLKILLGVEDIDLSNLPQGTVLVAEDITPSMTAGMDYQNVVGMVTCVGGRTSHAVILARALGIPAVVSVADAVSKINAGDQVVVDGGRGDVIVNPDMTTQEQYRAQQQMLERRRRELVYFKGRPTVTADGITKKIFCNIGRPEDMEAVLVQDGEGVGLFRTEFLFMDRQSLPDEEEQLAAYQKVLRFAQGRPVVIRTLDVGGDKGIPYLGLNKEENPFLGYRAVRYCLHRKDVYRTQLRAILRAAPEGDLRLLLPLVTTCEEVMEVRAMVGEMERELQKQGLAYRKDIKLGIMIETPAACMMIDKLVDMVDFFSIGTNDLTQYIMAADRGNERVSYLCSPYNPAVLRAIRRVIRLAKREGIEVGMCGEAAGEVDLIPLWLAFGLDEFSVSPSLVLQTRKVIANWRLEEAQQVARTVMEMESETQVRTYLEKARKDL